MSGCNRKGKNASPGPGFRRISNALFFKHNPRRDREIGRGQWTAIEALLSLHLDLHQHGKLLSERAYSRIWNRTRKWVRERLREFEADPLSFAGYQLGDQFGNQLSREKTKTSTRSGDQVGDQLGTTTLRGEDNKRNPGARASARSGSVKPGSPGARPQAARAGAVPHAGEFQGTWEGIPEHERKMRVARERLVALHPEREHFTVWEIEAEALKGEQQEAAG